MEWRTIVGFVLDWRKEVETSDDGQIAVVGPVILNESDNHESEEVNEVACVNEFTTLMATNNLRDLDSDYSEYEDVESSDEKEDEDTFFGLLTEEVNKLSIYGNDFNLTNTNRERVTKAGTYHWKCEKTITWNGREHTNDLKLPVIIKVNHSHRPDKNKLMNDELIKTHALSTKENPRDILIDVHIGQDEEVVAQSSSYKNIRQIVSRVRKHKAGFGPNSKSLSTINIPLNLRVTYRDKLFLFYDSGENDPNRILIFTTESNLSLLEKFRDWYCDGTFDISPVLFTQLYTIHIIVNNKDILYYMLFYPTKNKLPM
ncbi:unnamed protein product [Brachionus calyciflorus]|uniref:FLYWCH-type domain-containing protein n=1 Tax=Brachionus calyciflorus TaxID=104777 RepID=A0A814IZ85_9BILA|nr:unnamed protein product [Brachionus calyciflorus]